MSNTMYVKTLYKSIHTVTTCYKKKTISTVNVVKHRTTVTLIIGTTDLFEPMYFQRE